MWNNLYDSILEILFKETTKKNNKVLDTLTFLNINPLDYDHYEFKDPLKKIDLHDQVSGVIRKSSSFQIDSEGTQILIQRLDYIDKQTLIISYESKDSDRVMKRVVDKFAAHLGNDFLNNCMYNLRDYNQIYVDYTPKEERSSLIRLWNLGIAKVQIMDMDRKGAIVHSTIQNS